MFLSTRSALKNITVEVPVGTTTQEGNIICFPSTFKSVALFFLGNYVAHAATVRTDPGSTTITIALRVILALLFPGCGAYIGCKQVYSCAIKAKTPLQRASRAKALCTVVRKKSWRAVEGQRVWPDNIVEWEDCFPSDDTKLEETGLKIHGNFLLPEGYTLRRVPPYIEVSDFHDFSGRMIELSDSYSITKSVVAIFQLFLSIATLVQTRGDQIERYGYAAFGLTVAPYAVASLTNLLSNIVTPDYSCLYLIRSNAMVEAETVPGQQAYIFDGVVGKLSSSKLEQVEKIIENYSQNPKEDSVPHPTNDSTNEALKLQGQDQAENQPSGKTLDKDNQDRQSEIPDSERINMLIRENPFLFVDDPRHEDHDGRDSFEDRKYERRRARYQKERSAFIRSNQWASTLSWLIQIAIPLAIVGGLSGFRRGSSTKAQRTWIMGWLVSGPLLGVLIRSVPQNSSRSLMQSYEDAKMIAKNSIDRGDKTSKLRSRSKKTLKIAYIIISQICLLILQFVFGAFGVGTFVVVGKMIAEYGDCKSIYG